MCQYLVFFIISFLSFGLQKRLLDDPATISEDRRDLGMFGHQPRRHYEDYFAKGHNYRESRRRRSEIHQTRVGDEDIKLHDLPGHFPFDKEDGDNWESILEKSKQEADAMAAEAKTKDDAEMQQQNNEEKSKEDQEKAKEQQGAQDQQAKDDEQNSDSGGSDENSDESSPDDQGKEDESNESDESNNECKCHQNQEQPCPCAQTGMKDNAQNGSGPDPVPGKHGLTANQNYVPDNIPRKKACEFTPANCYCGARPTQQMDLLCASKKREYCGWFCKHKMGGLEGKPKVGPDQFGENAPPKLKPEKRANPLGCPKPSLKTCEAIYSDPNSPDYVGDGYAPPGANCVCHIDQKTGHAVITDLPNSAAVPGANAAAAGTATSGAPDPSAPAGGAPAASDLPATTGAAPVSNGAGPDSGNSGNADENNNNPAVKAINDAASGVTNGIQDAKDQVNAAGQAASDTVNAASGAAQKVQEESKGMWHHAKGLASAAGGHIGNAASTVWNGVKNVGKAIFGDEAEAQVQGRMPGFDRDTEFVMSGDHDHPTRSETSVANGLSQVFEDDEVALGLPGDFGVH